MIDIKDMEEHIVHIILFRLNNTLKSHALYAQSSFNPPNSPSMRQCAQGELYYANIVRINMLTVSLQGMRKCVEQEQSPVVNVKGLSV